MKTFLKIILWVLAACVAAAVVFLAIGAVTDFRPQERETVYEGRGDVLPDSLKVVTWNIGYGGLGDDMDFFYDGGARMRCDEERTVENLSGIIGVLKALDADVYLLQEVDECSRRSYRINQLELLRRAFPEYHLYFAYNYKSFFVPIPLSEPMGKVAGGVAILTRFRPDRVDRLAYPSRFPFPVSMFNLKRCLLSATFSTAGGDTVVIGNTHNTAYDTGDMRIQETAFLASYLDSLSCSGVGAVLGGDWNQYPPGYLPSADELDNRYFTVAPLDTSLLKRSGRIVYDAGEKTLRYLDRPFREGPAQSVTDYFFISEEVGVAGVGVCGNEGFRYADHKPVEINIVL
ncbi:MAG: hypothetical protein IAB81_01935 [Bacteroidetes bacterium]|uniref:Endonuclease/exonuclease/phosphatase domain-containing protein n=1 Tax=Candidatus Merdivivens pullicola TaxID=2840872 RepID=A0A9D9IIU6_9BACT|nr:hypothetical protein [Candidatus Merdivivens pullicola]